jgi:nucleotide-binding universal stress UspA family protein
MTKVDQFESVFRAAAKTVYAYQQPTVRTGAWVTDLEPSGAAAFVDRCRPLLGALGGEPRFAILPPERSRDVATLIETLRQLQPDLICTYRHLHSDAWRFGHGLGDHLTVMTQALPCPVLVLPHPQVLVAARIDDTDAVMAVTDHLTGDHRLVNWGAVFTHKNGTLFLTHIEDDGVFERYLSVIAKIPAIDTDTAREAIEAQLLKEPRDYIRSCKEVLAKQRADLRVEKVVGQGHRLGEYRTLIESHQIDLLVMNTKDEDQLAMHGLAYPLAVELRTLPLLML